jgi:3',5'-cyclic AMP phosphodiesterase CpdA
MNIRTLFLLATAAAATVVSLSAQAAPAAAPQRVAIADIQTAKIGSKVDVIGYFSHKSPEIDGDLEIYLIDHRGNFVVAEAPVRFRTMKYFIRGMHLHRGELVEVTGNLTIQHDKPTREYRHGWYEVNPVETVTRYQGPVPDDLHYIRVAHHFLGRVTVSSEGGIR